MGALRMYCKDFITRRKLLEGTLKPSNIDWSFNLMDKWLSSSHCPESAKASG
jgi:hypothetical protein